TERGVARLRPSTGSGRTGAGQACSRKAPTPNLAVRGEPVEPPIRPTLPSAVRGEPVEPPIRPTPPLPFVVSLSNHEPRTAPHRSHRARRGRASRNYAAARQSFDFRPAPPHLRAIETPGSVNRQNTAPAAFRSFFQSFPFHAGRSDTR